ncbi:hypothetical protein D7M15_15285 [Streptomyces sp. Z26]|nr:hypothetical protein D7M15_15285 [Streptomyces sp. Z26]
MLWSGGASPRDERCRCAARSSGGVPPNSKRSTAARRGGAPLACPPSAAGVRFRTPVSARAEACSAGGSFRGNGPPWYGRSR